MELLLFMGTNLIKVRGGNRPGSGAKKKENPKKNKTFRVDPIVYKKAKELYGGKLSQKINEFLKSLVEI